MELDGLFWATFDAFVSPKLMLIANNQYPLSIALVQRIRQWIKFEVNPNFELRQLVTDLFSRITALYRNLLGVQLSSAHTYIVYSVIIEWIDHNPRLYYRNSVLAG